MAEAMMMRKETKKGGRTYKVWRTSTSGGARRKIHIAKNNDTVGRYVEILEGRQTVRRAPTRKANHFPRGFLNALVFEARTQKLHYEAQRHERPSSRLISSIVIRIISSLTHRLLDCFDHQHEDGITFFCCSHARFISQRVEWSTRMRRWGRRPENLFQFQQRFGLGSCFRYNNILTYHAAYSILSRMSLFIS